MLNCRHDRHVLHPSTMRATGNWKWDHISPAYSAVCRPKGRPVRRRRGGMRRVIVGILPNLGITIVSATLRVGLIWNHNTVKSLLADPSRCRALTSGHAIA